MVAGSGIAADAAAPNLKSPKGPAFDQLNLHAFNTAALKTFAPAMRRQLIEAVGRKSLPLGVSIKAIHWESC